MALDLEYSGGRASAIIHVQPTITLALNLEQAQGSIERAIEIALVEAATSLDSASVRAHAQEIAEFEKTATTERQRASCRVWITALTAFAEAADELTLARQQHPGED